MNKNPLVSSQSSNKTTSSAQSEKKSTTSAQIQSPRTASSKTQPRETPPDFTVFDAKGNSVKLSDYAGKPIVVNFWASWCPPCKEEMPSFNKQYAKNKDKVVFLMVDLVDGQRETQAKGQTYYNSQGFSFPIYFDNQQQAAKAYTVSTIPVTLFIDSNGKIVKKNIGKMTEEKIAQAIESIK